MPGTPTRDPRLTQGPFLTPAPSDRFPSPAPGEQSGDRELVGQDPAPTALRREPGSAKTPSIQRSPKAGPQRLDDLPTIAELPLASPDRAPARLENGTIEPAPAQFSELRVEPLAGPAARFQRPGAQVPLVGGHPSTGPGLPAGIPGAATDDGAGPPVQRSRTVPGGSIDPGTPADVNLPESRSHTAPRPSVGPNSQAPLPVARRNFSAAPYLPEQTPKPAGHNAPLQVQRAAYGRPARDSFVAPAQEAADAAIAAGMAGRAADGALVFRSPEADAAPIPPASPPPPAPLPASVPVQRTTVSAPSPADADDDDRLPPDLDELAMRLYPKLRPYLRKDLWLDRERSGLLADLR